MQPNFNANMAGGVEARESALRDASEAYMSGNLTVAEYEAYEQAHDVNFSSALIALAENSMQHVSSTASEVWSGDVIR